MIARELEIFFISSADQKRNIILSISIGLCEIPPFNFQDLFCTTMVTTVRKVVANTKLPLRMGPSPALTGRTITQPKKIAFGYSVLPLDIESNW